jgi:hypothetical protein
MRKAQVRAELLSPEESETVRAAAAGACSSILQHCWSAEHRYNSMLNAALRTLCSIAVQTPPEHRWSLPNLLEAVTQTWTTFDLMKDEDNE